VKFAFKINDEDVASLAFDEEGKITPVLGISAWDLERVNETIKRLKLNEHEPLSEARRKVWQQVDCLIDDFKKRENSLRPRQHPLSYGEN
jgi:peroxiredoxin